MEDFTAQRDAVQKKEKWILTLGDAVIDMTYGWGVKNQFHLPEPSALYDQECFINASRNVINFA